MGCSFSGTLVPTSMASVMLMDPMTLSPVVVMASLVPLGRQAVLCPNLAAPIHALWGSAVVVAGAIVAAGRATRPDTSRSSACVPRCCGPTGGT